MLAFRRQFHQEVATEQTNHDATERRITELYTKAVEQLGSDKAPVRLGGLYALERLAQDNPTQRQTIVNVICAYLRMPFSSEPLNSGIVRLDSEKDALIGIWQQERQVRLTAQRILADHLRIDWFQGEPAPGPAGPEFWPGMRLDLTGATLIDLNFLRVVTAEARFDGATFRGTAQFHGAMLLGFSSFQGAMFTQEAAFSRASFGGKADFSKATFGGKSWFSGASFERDADFNDASFRSDAMFYGTRFHETAEFQPTTFSNDALFVEAAFEGSAWFSSSTFKIRASFAGAEFAGDVTFAGVSFGGATDFAGASFPDGRPPFRETKVLDAFAQHAWPAGWRIVSNRKGEHLLGRTKDAAQSSSQPAVPADKNALGSGPG